MSFFYADKRKETIYGTVNHKEYNKRNREEGRAKYNKITTNNFYINIHDAETEDKLDWHYIDRTGAPFRSIFVVEPGTSFYVKYTIQKEAWDEMSQGDDYICSCLEIDGRRVKRHFDKYSGKTIKGIFRYPYWNGRQFQFTERHDGNIPTDYDTSRRLAAEEPKVGTICIKFFAAKSYIPLPGEDTRWTRKRKTMSKPPDADAIFMDSRVKQKHMTLRTTLGPDERDPTYFGSAPSARISDHNPLAQTITHYESAAALYNKGWINPFRQRKWRRYLTYMAPNGNWDTLVKEYFRREQDSSDYCNLVDNEDIPSWSRRPDVKKEEPAEIIVPRAGSKRKQESDRNGKKQRLPSADEYRASKEYQQNIKTAQDGDGFGFYSGLAISNAEDEEMEEVKQVKDEIVTEEDEYVEEPEVVPDIKADDGWTPYFLRPGVSKDDDRTREKKKAKWKELQKDKSRRGESVTIDISDDENEEPPVTGNRNYITRPDSIFHISGDQPPDYIDLT